VHFQKNPLFVENGYSFGRFSDFLSYSILRSDAESGTIVAAKQDGHAKEHQDSRC
jgi:hypothetical protein